MKEPRIPKQIKELSESQLREAIRSLQNDTWEEDALLRTLIKEIYWGTTVTTYMLMLAVPLAIELERRTAMIDVNERKPDVANVIVSYKFGVGEAKFFNNEFVDPSTWSTKIPGVTHWMYLPEKVNSGKK